MSTVEISAPALSASAEADVPAPPAPAADPLVLGLPAFTVGAIALGLALVGYLPSAAQAGVLPILLATTGVGLLVSAIWAATLGQMYVASLLGMFSGFWWSYALLVLGLTHGWYGVPSHNVPRVVGLFLISWTVVIVAFTLGSLRLPAAFTLLLSLIDLALILLAIGALQASSGVTKAGGVAVLAFAALGVYLFLGSIWSAVGGRPFPLGKPLID